MVFKLWRKPVTFISCKDPENFITSRESIYNIPLHLIMALRAVFTFALLPRLVLILSALTVYPREKLAPSRALGEDNMWIFDSYFKDWRGTLEPRERT